MINEILGGWKGGEDEEGESMLEVCYFYLNRCFPPSKGYVFVAECGWGSRVVGKGSRENGKISLGCSMTPDARPLTIFPFRVSEVLVRAVDRA